MNRKTLFAALACALLVFSMLGCGATNHLQSVTLSASLINGLVPTGQNGFYNLDGLGGTIQLLATANYSNGKSVPLHGQEVTYTLMVDPDNDMDDNGNLLSAPPLTAQISVTGLVTATEPAVCTWINVAVLPATTPTFAYVGDYIATASYQGMTSQPIYIPVASAVGITDPVNTKGQCGPQPTS